MGPLRLSSLPGTYLLLVQGWVPCSDNEFRNKWKRKKLKKADAEKLAAARLIYGVPVASRRRRVSATFCYGPGRRRKDLPNHFKSLFDGLVTAKLLVNDSPVWCAAGAFECIRGSETYTSVMLEDL